MKNTRVRLETALLRYNQQHSVELTIAVGYDCLVKGDSITKLISRADTMMYEDKHRQKEEAKKTALQGC